MNKNLRNPNRRSFLKMGGSLIATTWLTACGDDTPAEPMGGMTGGDMGGMTGGNMGGMTGGDMGGMTGGGMGGMTGGNVGGMTGGDMGGTTGGDMGGMTGGEMMDMMSKIEAWEAAGVLTPNDPGEWESKIVGHYPIVVPEGNTINVIVPHPMDADHYIEAIYVKSEAGDVIGYQEFTPEDAMAMASFEVDDASGEFMAYSVCNLHQVWKAPQVRTPELPGPWPDKINGHTPRIMIMDGQATVMVPHPMGEEHYIVGLYISDQDGKIIGKTQLAPTDEAMYTFELPEGVTDVTPWALCDDHDLWVGQSMSVEVAGKIQGWEAPDNVLTSDEPGQWADKVAGHYPVAMIEGNIISVSVYHPMDDDHYIEAIYLKDENGYVVGYEEFVPGETAYSEFEVLTPAGEYMAYAVCNLHQNWKAPLVRTADRPGPWADKVGSHTPVAEVSTADSTVTVTVPHPMTEEHFIVALYLVDQAGNMIDKVQLNPTDNPEATYTFALPETATAVTPWSLCDDHDLWAGAEVAVTR